MTVFTITVAAGNGTKQESYLTFGGATVGWGITELCCVKTGPLETKMATTQVRNWRFGEFCEALKAAGKSHRRANPNLWVYKCFAGYPRT